jgi:hypothetical protein
MKSQILEALKAKFVGVSEAILSKYAEKLAKKVLKEEDVATAVEGVTFQQILDSYGDSRATEASQTAVSNYEKKHGLKDGKAIEGGAPQNQNQQPDDVPAWAKTLIDDNKRFKEMFESNAKERVTASRKQKLNAVIEKLPASLRKAYERTSIDTLTDEEFDTLITEVEAEVGEIGNNIQARGAVIGQPPKVHNKTPQNTASEAEVDAVVGKLI